MFSAVMIPLTALAILAGLVAVLVRNRKLRPYRAIRLPENETPRNVAASILKAAGLSSVHIADGRYDPYTLYSPIRGRLFLDPMTRSDTYVCDVSFAAFEAAHALAYKAGRTRSVTVRELLMRAMPAASWIAWPFMLAGSIFYFLRPLLAIGACLYTFLVLVSLAFLPLEISCAKRAQRVIRRRNIAGETLVKALSDTGLASSLGLITRAFEPINRIWNTIESLCSNVSGRSGE